jgi:hypothetical protein
MLRHQFRTLGLSKRVLALHSSLYVLTFSLIFYHYRLKSHSNHHTTMDSYWYQSIYIATIPIHTSHVAAAKASPPQYLSYSKLLS